MIATVTRLCVLMAVVTSVAQAQPTNEMVRQANELLNDGDAQGALEIYSTDSGDDTADVPTTIPVSPLIAYDKACVHLALGQVDEAKPLLQLASHASERLDIAAWARFNLGYLAFEEGSQLAQTDPVAAIDTFKRSAELFQASYDLDATDPQTPRNIELARLAIRELEQRIEEQEKQEQEQQQQQNDLAEQLKQLADEQEQLARESREADKSEQTPEQQAEESQEIDETQKDLDKRTEEAQDALKDMLQQRPDNATQRASDRVREAQEKQDQAGQSLEEQNLEDAATEQDQAAQLLRRAAELLKPENEEQEPQDEGSEGDPEKEQDSDQQPEQGQEPQQSELEQMLQELLEKERQEREDRKRGVVAKPGTIRAVEKDW